MARPSDGDSPIKASWQAFAQEYMVDRNLAQAAIRAGYSKESARQRGFELFQKPEVKELIEELEKELSERVKIRAEDVVNRLWAIATADPNELVRFRHVNCRYCWGADHYYQWTQGEYFRARDKARAESKSEPDHDGGFGFDKTREPNPECPECRGEGVGQVVISDAVKASPSAKMLYAGLKEGQHGIEVKMHDQVAALVKVGQHIGMFKERVEHTGKDGGPIEQTVIHASKEDIQQVVKDLENEY